MDSKIKALYKVFLKHPEIATVTHVFDEYVYGLVVEGVNGDICKFIKKYSTTEIKGAEWV